uniref:Uncharacterized protein n=1 Tax=Siphoviridae sp. ctnN38 TaxID=2826455 RepID=A0A8S5N6Z7_9CAUD|nr:MAG TPA: hypothetical protein [Siphoviridae sp. ctnN38]
MRFQPVKKLESQICLFFIQVWNHYFLFCKSHFFSPLFLSIIFFEFTISVKQQGAVSSRFNRLIISRFHSWGVPCLFHGD